MRIKYYKPSLSNSYKSFSILIPSRNETYHIINCLEDIIAQKYPSNFVEIIVINDDSKDDTEQLITEFIHKNNSYSITLLNTKKNSTQGKKAAITLGIEHAQSDYIILTDADCRRGDEWLATINSFMISTQSKMVYAPVMFKAQSLFEKLQSLEFAGLVAIGGAAIEINNPNMCSGSNLILEKNVFEIVEGYKGSENTATGDDEYLLHKVCKKFPREVRFLKNYKAVVTTGANKTLGELATQRKRWVSASTKYENIFITAILIGAYLFNAIIVYQLFLNPYIGGLLLLCKMLVEAVFLFNVLHFFKRPKYILLLPIAEPFHILYVLFIGIWANIGSYNWKGRDVK